MTIDPYATIYDELYREIAAMTPGEPIPSVRRLMARFSVSQLVIVRVMDRLREDFDIESQVGRGTFKGAGQPGQPVATTSIMFYLPDVYSHFQHEILSTMETAVAARNLRLQVRRYPWDRVPRQFAVTADTGGVLIMPPSFLTATELAGIEAIPVPTVLLDYIPHGMRLHGVASDNSFGGAMAANHLIDQGLSRLAMISAEPSLNANVKARRRGFDRQCRLAGIAAPRFIDGHSPMGVTPADVAYEVMRRTLADGPLDFQGLFADSAPTALGVLKACREAGIAVPDDLALIAFDDSPEARYMHPSISVLKQDVAAWAEAALDIIATPPETADSPAPHHVQIPPRLIVRESSVVMQPEHEVAQPLA